MARLKTAYRNPEKPPAETPAPSVQIDDERIQPSASTTIDFDTTDKTEPAVAVVSQDQYPEPDEATLALQNQLAHLKKSEELQREYARRMAQQQHAQPPTREQLLQAWRANGGDEGDISFLASHPEMIDRHDLTVVAAEEAAQQGFERGTPEHREMTKALFDRHLAGLQAPQAAPAAADPAGFFKPAPSPAPAPASPSALYSAPVSRQAPGTGYREPSPRSVRLSPEEQMIARASGISDIQYAEFKLKLEREKRDGTRQ